MSRESDLMDCLAEELEQLRGSLSERRGRDPGPRNSGSTTFDPAAPLLALDEFKRRARRLLRDQAQARRLTAVMVVRLPTETDPVTLADGPACLQLDVWDRIGALRLRHALRVDDPVADHSARTLVCLIPDLRLDDEALAICRRVKRHLGETIGRTVLSGRGDAGDLTWVVDPLVGMALFPRDGATIDGLLRTAESALLRAEGHAPGSAAYGAWTSATMA